MSIRIWIVLPPSQQTATKTTNLNWRPILLHDTAEKKNHQFPPSSLIPSQGFPLCQLHWCFIDHPSLIQTLRFLTFFLIPTIQGELMQNCCPSYPLSLFVLQFVVHNIANDSCSDVRVYSFHNDTPAFR